MTPRTRGSGKRRLLQKAVDLLGNLLFSFLAGDCFGSNSEMQPDLRSGRQALDGLSLFRELAAGVAPAPN